MANFNFKQIKAIEQKNKLKILVECPEISDESGIYVLIREENGFKYAYIGQAKRLLTRLASHLSGYQHIDLSLKKHGFYSIDNPTGWIITHRSCLEEELDRTEKELISQYASNGFQLRNKTAGGQGQGKVAIDNFRPSKGYYDGLKQGYINAQREVSKLFNKHLTVVYDNCYVQNGDKKPKANEQKAMNKFKEFIKEVENET